MRLIACLLALLCLGACAEPQRIYTTHPASHDTEIVPLILNDGFSLAERAKILRAVNEWNFALNGVICFDITTAASETAWLVVPSHAPVPNVPPERQGSYPLASAFSLGKGGIVTVYVERFGSLDIGATIMHELGHVLGIDHQPRGLMAAHYWAGDNVCVDLSTLTALASRRGVRLESFNWCEVK